MRILHILDHSIPLHSGYAFRTLAILKQQQALGWDTVQLTSTKHYGASEAEETVDGFKFYRTVPSDSFINKLPVLNQFAVIRDLEKRLDQVLKQESVDILHAHSPCLNGIAALRVGRRLKIPVVYELRASWEDAAVNHGTTQEGSLRYRISRGLETYVLKRADAITTICEGLKQDILLRGIPEEKVTVIPNAVDVEKFEEASQPDHALKLSLGLENKNVIGFLGSFYAYEGLDLLLHAVPLIQKNNPNIAVLLVGGGPQEENLKKLAHDLGVEQSVVFFGRVPHAEVNRYYDLIDILVYPRHSIRLTELVTPLKPLEAMAQKRMLVASDVGGHRELIKDGITGTLFKAGDAGALAEAVCNLINNQDIWSQRVQAAKAFVSQERNWRTSVLRYQEVYRKIVDNDKFCPAAV